MNIKTPNFTRLIAEVSALTGIDEIHAEALEELLNEECRMLNCYYWEEYFNELESARFTAYNAGYDAGYSAGHSESHSAV